MNKTITSFQINIFISILIFSIVVNICACKTVKFLGYISNGSDKLLQDKPTPKELSKYAVTTRDFNSNALNISVSQEYNISNQNSVDYNNYKISIAFSTYNDIPTDSPTFFIPILNSTNIKVIKEETSSECHEIYLMLSCNRLGYDLILSALGSPTGINGFAIFRNYVLPLKSCMVLPEFICMEVYYCKRILPSLLIKSTVEYPVFLDNLSYESKYGNQKTIRLRQKLKPQKNVHVILKDTDIYSTDVDKIALNKYLLYDRPFLYKYF